MGKPFSGSEGAKNRYITIRLLGSNSSEIHFKLKMTTQMSKVKKHYSDSVGEPVTSLRFLFNGKRIRDEDTPKLLEMQNDDVIEVYHEQTGGFNSTLSANKILQRILFQQKLNLQFKYLQCNLDKLKG